jgi:hypothetical protein
MSVQLDGDYQLVDAHHPSIAKALKLLRGYPETAAYVTKLLEDTRGGARHGFSEEVLEALLNIQREHQSLVKDSGDESNPWGDGHDSFDR